MCIASSSTFLFPARIHRGCDETYCVIKKDISSHFVYIFWSFSIHKWIHKFPFPEYPTDFETVGPRCVSLCWTESCCLCNTSAQKESGYIGLKTSTLESYRRIFRVTLFHTSYLFFEFCFKKSCVLERHSWLTKRTPHYTLVEGRATVFICFRTESQCGLTESWKQASINTCWATCLCERDSTQSKVTFRDYWPQWERLIDVESPKGSVFVDGFIARIYKVLLLSLFVE